MRVWPLSTSAAIGASPKLVDIKLSALNPSQLPLDTQQNKLKLPHRMPHRAVLKRITDVRRPDRLLGRDWGPQLALLSARPCRSQSAPLSPQETIRQLRMLKDTSSGRSTGTGLLASSGRLAPSRPRFIASS